MKLIILGSALVFMSISTENCHKSNRYRARLEIKGICMNYTISVLDPIDTSLVEASWTDENTGKTYTNAFALGSKCNFPANLNEGDEFYFSIDTSSNRDCNVCLAYYPVPKKTLLIKVVEKSD